MGRLHQRLNAWLAPAQPLVTLILLAIAALCVWAALNVKDPAGRTALAAWLVAP